MGEKRFGSLMGMLVHKDADSIDVIEAANLFSERKSHQSLPFGKFSRHDLSQNIKHAVLEYRQDNSLKCSCCSCFFRPK